MGIDLGLKRVGLALSDHSRTLATPFKTLTVSGDAASIAAQIAREIEDLRREDEGVDTIVVGLPKRLDGTEHDRAGWTRDVADRIAALADVSIVLQDERLTSHEAGQLLAARERDWRQRKQKLDAASAAVLLQDYLNQR